MPHTSTNTESVRYHVREMQRHETNLMIRYFLTADVTFLNGMGVDPEKLPTELEWCELLNEDFARPIRQRQFYYLVWEADGVPIGHCNINKIVFGEAAYMHLHIWDPRHRYRSCATQLLKPSIAWFFEKFCLGELFCEPYALNPGPNRTLPKFGFQLVKSYQTTPGWITFHQPVNLWMLEREAAIPAFNHVPRNELTTDPEATIQMKPGSKRKTVSSDTPWEASVGYSRAVRVGDHVFVSGTTASTPAGEVVAIGDAYGQTKFILQRIETVLNALGGTLADVVRTRMFVTDISQWEDVGKAHSEAFGDVRPAATMVEVQRLIHPEHLVEIEVDAVIAEQAD